MALGHPEPPTTFPEASSPHPMSLVRGQQPLPPGYQEENVLSNSALCPGIPTTGRDPCLGGVFHRRESMSPTLLPTGPSFPSRWQPGVEENSLAATVTWLWLWFCLTS